MTLCAELGDQEQGLGDTAVYTIDWSDGLAAGETISDVDGWSSPPGLTIVPEAIDSTSMKLTISGGLRQLYKVFYQVYTSESQRMTKSFALRVI